MLLVRPRHVYQHLNRYFDATREWLHLPSLHDDHEEAKRAVQECYDSFSAIQGAFLSRYLHLAEEGIHAQLNESHSSGCRRPKVSSTSIQVRMPQQNLGIIQSAGFVLSLTSLQTDSLVYKTYINSILLSRFQSCSPCCA